MIDLAQIAILVREPARFKRVRDIEFFEGPLVTEFVANNRERYLFIWRDQDTQYNRWLAVRTAARDIALYESRRISLLEIIPHVEASYLVDVDTHGKFKNWYLTPVERIPADYLPEDGSYFDSALRPPHSRLTNRNQDVLIQKDWGLSEIVEYPRRYLDVYAVQYLLAPGADKRINGQAFKYDFSSGWVYHNFSTSLMSSIPLPDRAKLKAIQVSSPGIMSFDLNEEISVAVARTVRYFITIYRDLKPRYESIHYWLLKQKRTKKDKGESNDKGANDQLPSRSSIKDELRRFCSALQSIDYERVDMLTGNNEINNAEIVLTYYRRLETLARYEIDGRALVVTTDPSVMSLAEAKGRSGAPDEFEIPEDTDEK